MCLLCDPPRPGRREDTFTTTPQAAGVYSRNVTPALPDDTPTLAELRGEDDWSDYA